ncbi:molybdopterin biosynthesis protein [Gossypium arboreum]|uniref:Molybdopterin biosynthesis protein n=1 Tax=Gossypium arboreum TaxID=29729 RepID=A0A0B0P4U8_GOSAR|nr:molybdopterin biosynthesis protein [Gossypium arboreum]
MISALDGVFSSSLMLPDQRIMRSVASQRNRKNTVHLVIIKQTGQNLLSPSNQGLLQIFMLLPIPIRQTNPSAINSRTLHELLQESTKSRKEQKRAKKGQRRTKSRRRHDLSLATRASHTPVAFAGVDQGFHDSHGLAIEPTRPCAIQQIEHSLVITSYGRGTAACPFFKELYFTQKKVLREEESQSKAYINTLSVI